MAHLHRAVPLGIRRKIMDTILLSTQNPSVRDTIRRVFSNNSSIHVAASPDLLWGSLDRIACDCLFIGLHELETLSAGMDKPADSKALLDRIKALRPTMATSWLGVK